MLLCILFLLNCSDPIDVTAHLYNDVIHEEHDLQLNEEELEVIEQIMFSEWWRHLCWRHTYNILTFWC